MSGRAKKRPVVFCLLGPTASGKTSMAVRLVQQFPVEIISVDSAQVYRGMNIGSGKPDSLILQMAPHRLIDIRDPAQPYSAAEFRKDALAHIAEITGRGRTPLLVGGTMLYFKALRDGIADMPGANPELRRQIDQLALAQGWKAVHARLAEVDPESAARIHRNDPQRLQRALEVYLSTGRSLTQHHMESGSVHRAGPLPYDLIFAGVFPDDRQALHQEIARRFRAMLDAGLVAEVDALFQRKDLHPKLPSIRSVGYHQVWQYLAGELSYDDMVEKSIIATRQLAKRQMTWMRSWGDLQILSIDPGEPKKSLDKLLKFVGSISI